LLFFYKDNQRHYSKQSLLQNSSKTIPSLPNPYLSVTEDFATPEPKITEQIKVYRTSDYIFFPVSKSVSLNGFHPNDLVVLDPPYSLRSVKVSNLILSDLKKMINDAKESGIDIKVVSGFRSYSDQEYLFNSYISQERRKNPSLSDDELVSIVNQFSAKPGHSEHQLGTTIDIGSNENGYKLIVDENAKYQKWLLENSQKYNFRISYPKGNPEYIYEPWHLRWWPK